MARGHNKKHEFLYAASAFSDPGEEPAAAAPARTNARVLVADFMAALTAGNLPSIRNVLDDLDRGSFSLWNKVSALDTPLDHRVFLCAMALSTGLENSRRYNVRLNGARAVLNPMLEEAFSQNRLDILALYHISVTHSGTCGDTGFEDRLNKSGLTKQVRERAQEIRKESFTSVSTKVHEPLEDRMKVLLETKKTSEALALLERASQAEHTLETRRTLVELLFKAGKVDEALAIIRPLVQPGGVHAHDPASHIYYAKCRIAKGDAKAAHQHLVPLTHLQTGGFRHDADMQAITAEAHIAMGHPERAANNLRILLFHTTRYINNFAIDCDVIRRNPNIHIAYAHALGKQGKISDARDHLATLMSGALRANPQIIEELERLRKLAPAAAVAPGSIPSLPHALAMPPRPSFDIPPTGQWFVLGNKKDGPG